MKRLKLNLSVFAMILGVGSAVAFTPAHKKDLQKWGRLSDGTYINITGLPQDQTAPYDKPSYHCNMSAQICTTESETQPSSTNPPTTYVAGTFVQVQP